MLRLTRWAVCLPLVVTAMPATVSAANAAGSMPASRYVTAPADPAPAPGEPRDVSEPRDMTIDRAGRRALRGRTRDRAAPEAPPVMQALRDMTAPSTAPPANGGRRRLESFWEPMPGDDGVLPNRRAARTAPASPMQAGPAAQSPQPTPAHPALAAGAFGSDVRLTQTQSNANPAPGDPTIIAPDAPTAAPTPLERSRSRSLNKSVRQIGLVEPVDVEGIRPANIAAELQPATSPIQLSGSPFGVAHPQRYLYCFSHNPLYFEDANLERCGLGHGFCQPAASAAQFLGRTVLLPYSLIAHSPCSCETTLGDCPTCHAYPWGAEVHR